MYVKKIIIISDGNFGDPIFFKKKIAEIGEALIIACDGGVRHLQKLGIKPDVIIGDMDSIEPAQLASYSAQGVKIIKYPANKDFTDTELALDYALNLKPTAIYIWGRWAEESIILWLMCFCCAKDKRQELKLI